MEAWWASETLWTFRSIEKYLALTVIEIQMIEHVV